jgi:hypothetical protein
VILAHTAIASRPAIISTTVRVEIARAGQEYRVFPESQAPVENSTLAIAGPAFHSEQIFTGWGLLKGGPFRFSELAGEPTSSDQVVASRRKPFFVELGDHDAIAHNAANEASANLVLVSPKLEAWVRRPWSARYER